MVFCASIHDSQMHMYVAQQGYKGTLCVQYVCRPIQSYSGVGDISPVHTSPNPSNCPRLVRKKGYKKMDGGRLMEDGLR